MMAVSPNPPVGRPNTAPVGPASPVSQKLPQGVEDDEQKAIAHATKQANEKLNPEKQKPGQQVDVSSTGQSNKLVIPNQPAENPSTSTQSATASASGSSGPKTPTSSGSGNADMARKNPVSTIVYTDMPPRPNEPASPKQAQAVAASNTAPSNSPAPHS
jgi:hypothetical protein